MTREWLPAFAEMGGERGGEKGWAAGMLGLAAGSAGLLWLLLRVLQKDLS